MNNLVEQDQDRLKLLKKYGYDIPKIRNRILAKAGLSFDGNMLEVGTGRGHMAVALARKGFKFVSIDLDKNGQEVAKTYLKMVKGQGARGKDKCYCNRWISYGKFVRTIQEEQHILHFHNAEFQEL